ncbi:MAG: hypothetical protein PQJ60_01455, partial [Spirochaetales bacterium]|nr:hypothetical protein [Spirochaetales bacterium]
MKLNLSVWNMLCAVLMASALFFSGCDDASGTTSSASASLSLGTVGTDVDSVSAAQDSESVSITITVTENNGASADSVTVSGSTIGDTELNDSDSDGIWEGTITPDASDSADGDSLSFTVTAVDNTSLLEVSTTFTLTVGAAKVVEAGGAYISAFITCPDNSYNDGDKAWVEVILSDVSELGDEWYVIYGAYNKIYTAFSSTSLDSGATLADDDVIRIHTSGTEETFDSTSKSDDSFGNDDIWDFEAEHSYVNTDYYAYGMFYIAVGDGDTSDTSESTDTTADYVISVIPFFDTVDN